MITDADNDDDAKDDDDDDESNTMTSVLHNKSMR